MLWLFELASQCRRGQMAHGIDWGMGSGQQRCCPLHLVAQARFSSWPSRHSRDGGHRDRADGLPDQGVQGHPGGLGGGGGHRRAHPPACFRTLEKARRALEEGSAGARARSAPAPPAAAARPALAQPLAERYAWPAPALQASTWTATGWSLGQLAGSSLSVKSQSTSAGQRSRAAPGVRTQPAPAPAPQAGACVGGGAAGRAAAGGRPCRPPGCRPLSASP